jgi:cell wall assembly regulator SMI1/predicted DNA-binding WGR domain protein
MGKRRFELVEGTSSKFWTVWIDGTKVHTEYGRIGAAGRETIKDEKTAAAAKKLHDALVAEKTKKGYREAASGKKAAPAKKAAMPPANSAKSAASSGDHAALIAKIEKKAKAAGIALAPGASEKTLLAAEKALGQKLPDEVRAFYRAHDGATDDPAVRGRQLLSLKGVLGQWKIWKDLYDEGTFGENDHSEPGKGVQQKWWIPEWIPVTYDYSGNHEILDLAPGKGGTHGQILDFWHDDPTRKVVKKSFLAWLAAAEWGED